MPRIQEIAQSFGITLEQSRTITSVYQLFALADGVPYELARRFENPFQTDALAEGLTPEQALTITNPDQVIDLENGLSYEQVFSAINQEGTFSDYIIAGLAEGHTFRDVLRFTNIEQLRNFEAETGYAQPSIVTNHTQIRTLEGQNNTHTSSYNTSFVVVREEVTTTAPLEVLQSFLIGVDKGLQDFFLPDCGK